MENKVINVQMDEETFKKFQSGGGGSEGGMKFYDVSQYMASNGTLYPIVLCGMLVKLNVNNNILIMTGAAIAEDASMFDKTIAIGVDLSQKMILRSGEGSFEAVISSILPEITEITKEEFYHIPQDEVWPLNTQEDYKAAWDKLYPLVERYGADYINENKLSLAPWYKSLTIGDNVVTELYWYSLAEDGDSKRERISFTQYTGIEKYTYTDGTIEYQSYNPPM